MSSGVADAAGTTGRTRPSPHPTIRDVAARAGVSKSLVSLALQNAPRVAPETRQAILEAAEELGYRRNAAAHALGAHRTRTIGVFVLDLHNPITADVLDAVQAEARRRDYRTIVVVGGDDAAAERAELEKLLEFRVEGIIALGHRLPDGAREAITADCPAVIIGSEQPGIPHLGSMRNDDVLGAGLAVDHLVALGHERIAHVDGGPSTRRPGPTPRLPRRDAATRAGRRRHRGQGVVHRGRAATGAPRGPWTSRTRPPPCSWSTTSRRWVPWRPWPTGACRCPRTSRSWATTAPGWPASGPWRSPRWASPSSSSARGRLRSCADGSTGSRRARPPRGCHPRSSCDERRRRRDRRGTAQRPQALSPPVERSRVSPVPLTSLPTPRTADSAEAPPLRWGILGTGWIADTFVTSLRRHTRQVVHAVGSRTTESARRAATAWEVPVAHGSYEALVADPSVDVVYVATPHNYHLPHALLAIEAGKHVLVEKPVGLDADEARAIGDAAARRRRVLHGGHVDPVPAEVRRRAPGARRADARPRRRGAGRHGRAVRRAAPDHADRTSRAGRSSTSAPTPSPSRPGPSGAPDVVTAVATPAPNGINGQLAIALRHSGRRDGLPAHDDPRRQRDDRERHRHRGPHRPRHPVLPSGADDPAPASRAVAVLGGTHGGARRAPLRSRRGRAPGGGGRDRLAAAAVGRHGRRPWR